MNVTNLINEIEYDESYVSLIDIKDIHQNLEQYYFYYDDDKFLYGSIIHKIIESVIKKQNYDWDIEELNNIPIIKENKNIILDCINKFILLIGNSIKSEIDVNSNNINGRIDILDYKNNIIYDIKCYKNIENYIQSNIKQLIIYSILLFKRKNIHTISIYDFFKGRLLIYKINWDNVIKNKKFEELAIYVINTEKNLKNYREKIDKIIEWSRSSSKSRNFDSTIILNIEDYCTKYHKITFSQEKTIDKIYYNFHIDKF